MNTTLIGFIIYLGILFIIGFLTYARNKSHTDFYIAGRKLNTWVTALSERASGESAWLLIGLPGAAYSVGLMEFWTAIGCILGIILYWLVVAKDLREQSEEFKAITLPTFIASKYKEQESVIRVLATLITIFFFTFYVAAQFNGAGKVLNVTFGLSNITGVVIGAGVIIFYTMMGGFFAVAWTDFVQAILMFFTLIVLPVVGYIELQNQDLTLFSGMKNVEMQSFTSGKTGWAAAAIVISGLSWGFGYFGQPHLLTRFMAIKHSENIKKGRIIAYSWAIPAFAGAFILGLIGLSLYGSAELKDVENIMPLLANQLLPAWLAGIILSGAIAAMMSTADSQLLVISSSVLEDIYYKTFNKNINERSLLLLSRIITIAVGLFGFLVAILSKKLVFALVSYAWAGLGAAFGPALICILKWEKTTGQGVIAGMLTGALTVVVWSNIYVLNDQLNARFVSFVFAFIAIIFTTYLTQGESNNKNGIK